MPEAHVVEMVPDDFPIHLRLAVDDYLKRHQRALILDCEKWSDPSMSNERRNFWVYTVFLQWGDLLQTLSWSECPEDESLTSWRVTNHTMKAAEIQKFTKLSGLFR